MNIILNENTRCFTSYNKKELNVWNPLTGETLFKFCFNEDHKSNNQNSNIANRKPKDKPMKKRTNSVKEDITSEDLNLANMPLPGTGSPDLEPTEISCLCYS